MPPGRYAEAGQVEMWPDRPIVCTLPGATGDATSAATILVRSHFVRPM